MFVVNLKMSDARGERIEKRRLIEHFHGGDFARLERNVNRPHRKAAQDSLTATNRNRAFSRLLKFRFEIRFAQKRVLFEPPFVIVQQLENRFRRCGNNFSDFCGRHKLIVRNFSPLTNRNY